jgi:hypothetical protein
MLSIVVNTITQEMEKVNNSERITFNYKYKAPTNVSWMMYFQGFYGELHDLLRVREDATKRINKNPTPPILRYSSPRTESTISNATDGTGISAESNKEHHTQAFARAFLLATLQTLEGPLTAGAWFSTQCEFSVKCVPLKSLLSVRGDQEMSLKLGGREIEARSDGGVNFYPKWGFQTYYPMLSIEVVESLLSDADL